MIIHECNSDICCKNKQRSLMRPPEWAVKNAPKGSVWVRITYGRYWDELDTLSRYCILDATGKSRVSEDAWWRTNEAGVTRVLRDIRPDRVKVWRAQK